MNYQSDYGKAEAFGNFATALDAIKWMKSDVEYNIENAKKNRVDLEAETMNDGLTMKINEYGTWNVVQVTTVGL